MHSLYGNFGAPASARSGVATGKILVDPDTQGSILRIASEGVRRSYPLRGETLPRHTSRRESYRRRLTTKMQFNADGAASSMFGRAMRRGVYR